MNMSTDEQLGLHCPLHRSVGSDPSSTDSNDARPRQKTCRVCGDHATGYNFNVITCESCKAFFRRNALRPKEFKCPYSEDCDINAVSRRFCQKCRLRKCFIMGMKREWILNEDQLRRRKNSRLHNTGINNNNNGDQWASMTGYVPERRLSTTESVCSNNHAPITPTSSVGSCGSPGLITTTTTVTTTGGNDDHEPVTITKAELIRLMTAKRSSDCSCVCVCGAVKRRRVDEEDNKLGEKTAKMEQVGHDVDRMDMVPSSSPENENSVLRAAIAIGEPALKINYQLSIDEQRNLDEVKDAFSVLNEPLDERSAACLAKDDHNPNDILNIMDITMRRLIHMTKRLSIFNDMSSDTKLALLKDGLVEMLTMRGVTRFDMNEKCWKSPLVHNKYHVSFKMFDRLKRDEKDVQKAITMQFMSSMEDDIRTDELAIDLAVLIVLFNPNRPNVPEKDVHLIASHNEFYRELLRRYLESLHGYEAQRKFDSLISGLSLLRRVSETSRTLFVGTVNPDDTQLLPQEFFKLNYGQ